MTREEGMEQKTIIEGMEEVIKEYERIVPKLLEENKNYKEEIIRLKRKVNKLLDQRHNENPSKKS